MSDWAVYESSFVMDENHIPDGATLNLVFESRGTVWIKDVEVLYLQHRVWCCRPLSRPTPGCHSSTART